MKRWFRWVGEVLRGSLWWRGASGWSRLRSRIDYRKLMNCAGDAVFVTDRQGTILEVNEQACLMLMRRKEELIGRCGYDLFAGQAAQVRETSAQTMEVLGRGESMRLNVDLPGPTGVPIPTEVTVRAMEAAGETIYVSVARDATRARRTLRILQERNRALATLNSLSAVVSRTRSSQRVLRTAVSSMRRFTQADAGAVYEADMEARRLRLVYALGIPQEMLPEVDDLRLDEGTPGEALRTGKPVMVHDLTTDGRVSRHTLVKHGYHSALMVPLPGRDSTLGTISLLSKSVGRFDHVNLRLLTVLAEEVSLARQNARSLEREIEAKRRYQDLVLNAHGFIFRLDGQGRFVEVNPRLVSWTEASEEELLGTDALRWVAAKSRRRTLEMVRGCMGGFSQAGQLHIDRRGDSPGICEVTLLPLRGSDGRMQGLWGVAHDVTEEVLKDREVRALLAVARAAINTDTITDLCREVAQGLAKVLEIQGAAIYLHHESARTVELVAAWGGSEEATKSVRVQSLDRPGPGLAAQAAMQRRTVKVKDLTGRYRGTSFEPLLSEFPELAIHSLPLLAGGDLVGVLQLGTRPGDLLPTSETEFLEALAGELAGALRRRKLEFEQAREREQLDEIISSIGGGLTLMDSNLKVLWANRQISEWFSPGESAVGRSWNTLLGPSRRAGDISISTKALSSHHKEERDLELVLSDGRPRHFHVVVNPIAGTDGKVSRVLALLLDLTETRRLRDQVQRTEKLSAIGELVSGVAHELNNPLAAVLGFSELLLTGNEHAQSLQGELQRIHTEAARCKKIVQNLLSFSRQTEPQRSPVDINDVLASALELKNYQFNVDNVTVVRNLAPPGTIPHTLANPHQLQQVFLNILNNAHQAIGRGRRDGRVTVTSMPVDDRVRITIADNGPGIAPDILDRIFDPFFTTKDVGEGTGLGLSISYGHVRDHGGSIEVRSTPGTGATFIIELPLKPVSTQAASTPEEVPVQGVQRSADILVVDDEPTMTQLLRRILELLGHRVTTAHNGREAMLHVRDKEFDCLITDLRMPGMTGQELYAQLRRVHPGLMGKVIFTTGDIASVQTRRLVRRAGEHLLIKPFRLADVRSMVAKVLTTTTPDT